MLTFAGIHPFSLGAAGVEAGSGEGDRQGSPGASLMRGDCPSSRTGNFLTGWYSGVRLGAGGRGRGEERGVGSVAITKLVSWYGEDNWNSLDALTNISPQLGQH